MPDYVFADAKIGARTWHPIATNVSQVPTCMDSGVWWRTPIYKQKFVTTPVIPDWTVATNATSDTFTISLGPNMANTSAAAYFGLSNRVRSFTLKIEELPGCVSPQTVNNRAIVYCGRVRPATPTDLGDKEKNATVQPPTAVYPNRPRVAVINAVASPGVKLDAAFNVEQDLIAAETADGVAFNDNIYGCGFGMCVLARFGGGATNVGNWRITITPSTTPI